jgi:flagellar biosynthesis anti-sigma factor FlgM
MKIDNSSLNSISPNRSDGTQPLKNNSHTSEAGNTSSLKDKADLSEKARLFSKARAAFDSASQVDQSKVDLLKQKIQNGDYQIPYDNLTQSMMKALGISTKE